MDAVTIVANPAAHQGAYARALAAGLRAHGIASRICREHDSVHTKVVACWGWRIGELFRQRGHEVLVMERGYLGDRFKWTSLGWNGLNGRARFVDREDPARFREHFADLMEPIRGGGGYTLIIGQVPGDMSLRGRNLAGWYEEQAQLAARTYRLPVYFREHPVARDRGLTVRIRTARLEGSLREAIAGAAIVITFNSNTGVESVLAGCPTIAIDEGSMALPVAARRVGDATQFALREAWAHRLAWRQWRIEEITSGEAWAHVGAEQCAPVN